MSEASEFIGKGWGFPVRVDPNGSVALVSHEREIAEAIRIILGTNVGERPMRPEFGCNIHSYVFAPVDNAIAALLSYEVRKALDRWEPRITVFEVAVTPDEENNAVVYIDVRYVINATNSSRNLVFPFYTIPSEGSPG